MKTDRKLLELAAKAAGIPVEWDGDGFVRPVPFEGFTNYEPWNPLTDDGDALRLAVKLEMVVDVNNRVVAGYLSDICVDIDPEERERDPLRVIRLAIVHAAAEIGKAMLAAKEGTNGEIN